MAGHQPPHLSQATARVLFPYVLVISTQLPDDKRRLLVTNCASRAADNRFLLLA
jgi:hypothetical protein